MFFRVLGSVDIWALSASLARTDRRSMMVKTSVEIKQPGWEHPDLAKWAPMKSMLAKARTTIMQAAPQLELTRAAIDTFEPGFRQQWMQSAQPDLAVHIPVVTNPGMALIVNNETMHVPAGCVVLHALDQWHSAINIGQWKAIHVVLTLAQRKIEDE